MIPAPSLQWDLYFSQLPEHEVLFWYIFPLLLSHIILMFIIIILEFSSRTHVHELWLAPFKSGNIQVRDDTSQNKVRLFLFISFIFFL